MSLAVLICVFFDLPNFAGRAHNGQSNLLQYSSLDASSLTNLSQEPSLYISLTSFSRNHFISSNHGIFEAISLFFNSPTNLFGTVSITILLVLTLSLYRRNNLKTRVHNLLELQYSELQEEKEKAEKEAIGNAQCLSTICHEVRTPLNSSTGILQLLLDSDLNSEQLEYLNALQFSSDYLISLADNVLMLNKLDVYKPEIHNEPFNLKETFDHLISLLHSSARANNTKIHLEFDPRIPKEIMGDNTKISQVLINLLGNAVNFTDNGQIWIRTLAKDLTADTVEILVEIQDTGVGIPKEEHNLVFESFSQGMLSKNRKKGGTGLGLAIVKVLLEILESEIHLESELGKGSTFWFVLECSYLPVASKNIKYQLSEKQSAILANKSVLLVEDDLISQIITKKLLEREKMNCMIIDNGEEALELIKYENFHLVLMDLSIRGISGLEAAKEIRKFNNEIPIIALTAVDIDENWPELNNAGFNGVIPKPFKIDNLFDKIQTALNQNPPRIPSSLESEVSSQSF